MPISIIPAAIIHLNDFIFLILLVVKRLVVPLTDEEEWCWLKIFVFENVYRLKIFPGGFSLNLTRVNFCSRNLLYILVEDVLLFLFEGVKIYPVMEWQISNRYKRNLPFHKW